MCGQIIGTGFHDTRTNIAEDILAKDGLCRLPSQCGLCTAISTSIFWTYLSRVTMKSAQAASFHYDEYTV